MEEMVVKKIYVSPHSDDVALSCGGRILADPLRQDDVIVLNIFTSERSLPYRDDNRTEGSFVDSISHVRSAEDRAAWKFAGVQADYIDLPEALLRHVFPFALVSRQDNREIVDEIVRVIHAYAHRYPGAAFFFPAGIGNHVDHLTCRDAAFRCLDKRILDRITLYEDAPYSWLRFVRKQSYRALLKTVALESDDRTRVLQHGGESMPSYLGRRNVPFPRGRALFLAVHAALVLHNATRRSSRGGKLYRGRIQTTALDEEVASHKIALLHCYESQLPMLFGVDPAATLNDHAKSLRREVVIEVSRAIA